MFDNFKQDVRRWIVPGSIAPPGLITIGRTLRLLLRYKPLRAMLWFRLGSWCSQYRIRFVPSLMMWMLNTFYGMDIAIGPHYGGGLYVPHPVGMVISPTRIGQNCSLIAAITIGMRNEHAFPIIGDNVFVGAGARVLGGITIGDRVVIGANAVVIKDVPPGATVVGIPARIVHTITPLENPDSLMSFPADPALEISAFEQTIAEE